MACIEFDRGDLATAKAHLQALLTISPQFNYGDASLLYGHILFQLNEFNSAITHLEFYLQYWSNPEAHLLMAMVQQRQGDCYAARHTLETMLRQIHRSAPMHYRRHQGFLKQGQRMLRGLTR
jgi:hypothetical protein